MKLRRIDVDHWVLTLVRYVLIFQVEIAYMIAQMEIIVQGLTIGLRNFIIQKNIKLNFAKHILTE
jgi:hypothetical protein